MFVIISVYRINRLVSVIDTDGSVRLSIQHGGS